MNTPGGSNVTTAEHAIAMLLALARNIPQATAAVRAGEWPRSRWIGTEVCNKMLGVVGLGNIGAIVAERALGLRMKVIAFDPFVTAEAAARLRVELVSLDDSDRAQRLHHHPRSADDGDARTARRDQPRPHEARRAHHQLRPRRHRRRGRARRRDPRWARGRRRARRLRAGAAADGPSAARARAPSSARPTSARPPSEAQVSVAIAIAEQVADFLVRDVIQNAVNVPSIAPRSLQVLRPYLHARREARGSRRPSCIAEPPLEVTVAGGRRDRRARDHARSPRRRAARAARTGCSSRARQLRERAVDRARARHPGGRVAGGAAGRLPERHHRPGAHRLAHTTVVEGAVFGADIVRLTKIDDFRMEAVPEGYILMLHNRDVPGVVGRVGTLLGERSINIAGLELGRERAGGMALSLFHVDDQFRAPCWTSCARCRRSSRPSCCGCEAHAGDGRHRHPVGRRGQGQDRRSPRRATPTSSSATTAATTPGTRWS